MSLNGNEVAAESNQIFAGCLKIDAAVVLHVGVAERGHGLDEDGVGNSVEAAADPKGGARGAESRILGAQRGLQRRPQIEAIRCVAALRRGEPDLSAGLGDGLARRRPFTGVRQKLAGDAAARSRVLQEIRGLIPARRYGFRIVPDGLVRGEVESLILPEGSSKTTAHLVEAILVARHRAGRAGAIPFLIGVQSRTVPLEERAAVVIVGDRKS